MPRAADKIPENIDFAAQELLEAPAADRPALLDGIAKALTRRLLKDNPGIAAREVCLDILLLRDGRPGNALSDIDNRLKTIFDALRQPKESELERPSRGPTADENPFYVVL